MASINKKDLRLLKPGELVMAKTNFGCFINEKNSNIPAGEVQVSQGDLLLVIEDQRTTNTILSPDSSIIKFLYGEKLIYLYKPSHIPYSKYIAIAKPGKK